MLTRRKTLLGAILATLAGGVQAADSSAHNFVAAIYNTYVGKNGNGVALDEEAIVRRYFEPSLAALILKDQKDAARRNEVGALDFDPFVDAQDWDIPAFTVTVSDAGADKATATVKFTDSGKASTVVLDLVKINNDWKIANVTWMPHDTPNNLRALFAQ
jgi:hypothetical protein